MVWDSVMLEWQDPHQLVIMSRIPEGVCYVRAPKTVVVSMF